MDQRAAPATTGGGEPRRAGVSLRFAVGRASDALHPEPATAEPGGLEQRGRLAPRTEKRRGTRRGWRGWRRGCAACGIAVRRSRSPVAPRECARGKGSSGRASRAGRGDGEGWPGARADRDARRARRRVPATLARGAARGGAGGRRRGRNPLRFASPPRSGRGLLRARIQGRNSLSRRARHRRVHHRRRGQGAAHPHRR